MGSAIGAEDDLEGVVMLFVRQPREAARPRSTRHEGIWGSEWMADLTLREADRCHNPAIVTLRSYESKANLFGPKLDKTHDQHAPFASVAKRCAGAVHGHFPTMKSSASWPLKGVFCQREDRV